ncbi:hypothetical protein Q5752_004979 [Cryptotrichosporon argae]
MTLRKALLFALAVAPAPAFAATTVLALAATTTAVATAASTSRAAVTSAAAAVATSAAVVVSSAAVVSSAVAAASSAATTSTSATTTVYTGTPTLSFYSIATMTACSTGRITWQLSNENPVLYAVDFYAYNSGVAQSSSSATTSSTASAAVNATVVRGQSANVGYSWPTVDIPPGTYQLYAVVNDSRRTTATSGAFQVVGGNSTACLAAYAGAASAPASATSAAAASASTSASAAAAKSGIGAGAIAGIVVAVVAAAALAALLFWCRRRRGAGGAQASRKLEIGAPTDFRQVRRASIANALATMGMRSPSRANRQALGSGPHSPPNAPHALARDPIAMTAVRGDDEKGLVDDAYDPARAGGTGFGLGLGLGLGAGAAADAMRTPNSTHSDPFATAPNTPAAEHMDAGYLPSRRSSATIEHLQSSPGRSVGSGDADDAIPTRTRTHGARPGSVSSAADHATLAPATPGRKAVPAVSRSGSVKRKAVPQLLPELDSPRSPDESARRESYRLMPDPLPLPVQEE